MLLTGVASNSGAVAPSQLALRRYAEPPAGLFQSGNGDAFVDTAQWHQGAFETGVRTQSTCRGQGETAAGAVGLPPANRSRAAQEYLAIRPDAAFARNS